MNKVVLYALLTATSFCLLTLPIVGIPVSQSISSHGTVGYTQNGWLHTEGKWIKDEQGNIVRLRGVGHALMDYAYGYADEWYSNIGFIQSDTPELHDLLKRYGGDSANIFKVMLNILHWYTYADSKAFGRQGYPYVIDDLVQLAKERGIYVQLVPNSWGDPGEISYNEQIWYPETNPNRTILLNFLKDLATRYKDEPTVVGLEVLNEPGGGTLSSWKQFATEAIDAVHAINPNLLIFLEIPGYFQDKWKAVGLIDRPNLVYTTHNYYFSRIVWGPTGHPGGNWAQLYESGDLEGGKAALIQWITALDLWIQDQGFPVHCNEFGGYNKFNSDQWADRGYYMGDPIPNWDVVFYDQMEVFDEYYGGGWAAWAWDHEWGSSTDPDRTIAYTMLLNDYSDINFVGQIWVNYMATVNLPNP